MRALVYTSRGRQDFDGDALRDLLAESRERNAADDLSGVLIYAGGSFLQLLEGPDEALQRTYDRIAADPRHTDLRVLADEPRRDRRFPDWAMGFETPDDDLLTRVLPGYRPSSFPLADPATISSAAVAEALLAIYRGGS